jgi:hypothetical protein
MDDLGKLELEILHSFKKFSDTLEKIQNRPQFDKILRLCHNKWLIFDEK